MKLGFCTGWSEERFRFAKQAGFDGVEISVGGEVLNPDTITNDGIKKAKETLDKIGIAAITVFHYRNYADPNDAEAAMKAFRRTMDIAKGLGTDTITCNAWVPGGADEATKLASYTKTFGQFAKWAEDLGMKVGIENCPHGLHNYAFNPVNWSKMWEAVPSKAIGLEFDPSHLVFQQIDYIRALYDHGERVYAFHAKDTEIRREFLAVYGNHVGGWWRFRVPGYGDVDWRRIFIALDDIGYKGGMVIEHEDPILSGPRTDEGLRFGLQTLRRYVPAGG
jgi:sugar phosphate isomerase/epimerase